MKQPLAAGEIGLTQRRKDKKDRIQRSNIEYQISKINAIRYPAGPPGEKNPE